MTILDYIVIVLAIVFCFGSTTVIYGLYLWDTLFNKDNK